MNYSAYFWSGFGLDSMSLQIGLQSQILHGFGFTFIESEMGEYIENNQYSLVLWPK